MLITPFRYAVHLMCGKHAMKLMVKLLAIRLGHQQTLAKPLVMAQEANPR
jgi:hypothetical protein